MTGNVRVELKKARGEAAGTLRDMEFFIPLPSNYMYSRFILLDTPRRHVTMTASDEVGRAPLHF